MNISPKRINRIGIVSFNLSSCTSTTSSSLSINDNHKNNVNICEPLRYALDHIIKNNNDDVDNSIYDDFIDDSINLSSLSNDQLCDLINNNNISSKINKLNELNNKLQYYIDNKIFNNNTDSIYKNMLDIFINLHN